MRGSNRNRNVNDLIDLDNFIETATDEEVEEEIQPDAEPMFRENFILPPPRIAHLRFLFPLGPEETLKLCKMNSISCPKDGIIYKFIKSAEFLGKDVEPLSFFHALRCNRFKESPNNYIGFQTKNECLETIILLRNEAGLTEFEQDQKADILKIGFINALKCRWMRKKSHLHQITWDQALTTCLGAIETERTNMGYRPFNETELAELHEARYNQVPGIEPTIDNRWNPELLSLDGHENYSHLKVWLDQDGAVNQREHSE